MQLTAHAPVAPLAGATATRRWMTAGVALAGAGAIAVAPGITPVPFNALHDATASAVRLSAGWNPLAPWQEAFNAAQVNGATVTDNFLLAPGVALQQAIRNQIGYLQQVIDDPSSIQDVASQIYANAKTVTSAITLIGADEATRSTATSRSLDGLHGLILNLLPTFLPSNIDPDAAKAVLDVLASPLSGVAIGLVGPLVSPGVALLNSLLEVSGDIRAGDATEALQDLWGAPARIAGSFFNGATLNLDPVASLLNRTGVLGDGTTIDSLDIAFGGLFTPGSPGKTYEIKDDAGNTVKTITAPGGSIVNSIGMTVSTDALGVPITLPIPGNPVGPIGALEGMSQTAGVLLGSGWDGKGNPQAPLFGYDFVTHHFTTNLPTLQLPDSLAQAAATVQKLVAAAQNTVSEDTSAGVSPTDESASVAEKVQPVALSQSATPATEKPSDPVVIKDTETVTPVGTGVDGDVDATPSAADDTDTTAPVEDVETTGPAQPSHSVKHQDPFKAVKTAVDQFRSALSGKKPKSSTGTATHSEQSTSGGADASDAGSGGSGSGGSGSGDSSAQ